MNQSYHPLVLPLQHVVRHQYCLLKICVEVDSPAKKTKEKPWQISLTKVDFIASHIPDKCEQMVRYMGYYRNVFRGRQKKEGITELRLCHRKLRA